jgi:hypothetical protein
MGRVAGPHEYHPVKDIEGYSDSPFAPCRFGERWFPLRTTIGGVPGFDLVRDDLGMGVGGLELTSLPWRNSFR